VFGHPNAAVLTYYGLFALQHRGQESAGIVTASGPNTIFNRHVAMGLVSQVVSPAVGGIIPGYETARHLGVPAIYTERVEGKFQLRRNFAVAPGEKVIVVEDIVSTGLSIRECVEALKALGANVVAAACIIDRSDGEADIGVPLVALTRYKVPAYPAHALPPELAAIPAVKPGSRGLA